jgi:hypothetical protein
MLGGKVPALAPQHRQQHQRTQYQPHFHQRERAEIVGGHTLEHKRCTPDGAQQAQFHRRQPAGCWWITVNRSVGRGRTHGFHIAQRNATLASRNMRRRILPAFGQTFFSVQLKVTRRLAQLSGRGHDGLYFSTILPRASVR